jgi:hypothetical protein
MCFCEWRSPAVIPYRALGGVEPAFLPYILHLDGQPWNPFLWGYPPFPEVLPTIPPWLYHTKLLPLRCFSSCRRWGDESSHAPGCHSDTSSSPSLITFCLKSMDASLTRKTSTPRISLSAVLAMNTQVVNGRRTRVSITNASFEIGRISPAFPPTIHPVGLSGLKDGPFLLQNLSSTIQWFNQIRLIPLLTPVVTC